MTNLFGIDALPYGVFSAEGAAPRIGVRYGEDVIDLGELAARPGGSCPVDAAVFAAASLNPMMALGRPAWTAIRDWVRHAVSGGDLPATAVRPSSQVTMQLPIEIGDYVDFYASENHATNVGRIFRPDGAALTPNWKHLPIGYHGRSGTIVVDGTDIVRPCGQRKGPNDPAPVFGPCTRLDIEAELGFVIGKDSTLGVPVTLAQAADYLFGVVILNDWSARDIQAWEYVPLGPFLGKSFASSISAWVLPFEALAEATFELPDQDPAPLPYLSDGPRRGLRIQLEVELDGQIISRPDYAGMYWSPEQMVAHLTVNGASTRVGDLLGSGTVSGSAADTRGSLLELTWSGAEPLTLADGSTRSFLQDGDTIRISAWAPGPDGSRIGLGPVTGTIRPARG